MRKCIKRYLEKASDMYNELTVINKRIIRLFNTSKEICDEPKNRSCRYTNLTQVRQAMALSTFEESPNG